jgi:hypothetical protein
VASVEAEGDVGGGQQSVRELGHAWEFAVLSEQMLVAQGPHVDANVDAGLRTAMVRVRRTMTMIWTSIATLRPIWMTSLLWTG